MTILAFAASNNRNSINKKLVSYALNQLKAEQKTLLDLNDFPAPIYGVDLEREIGLPESVKRFAQFMDDADVIMISFAEHNGTYTAVFKNLFDWVSVIKSKCFENKKFVLLSTSHGARGGRGVMDAALTRFPIHGAEILGHLCFPKFNENFDEEKGVVNHDLNKELNDLLALVYLEQHDAK